MHQPLGHFASLELLPDVFGKTMGNLTQVWFTKNSDSEFSNNRSMQKTSKNLGCLFSVVVPGYCLLIFLFHCF